MYVSIYKYSVLGEKPPPKKRKKSNLTQGKPPFYRGFSPEGFSPVGFSPVTKYSHVLEYLWLGKTYQYVLLC